MAEIIQRDGTWAFDGSTVRITPGLSRSVPLFRRTYGEVSVPLEAVSGITFEAEGRRGRLRLRLREGADPLLQAAGGRLPDAADPYRLAVDADRCGAAEYVVEEVRRALLLDRIPQGPTRAYLLPGPPVPVSVRSSDGTVSFDGSRVRIDWADTSDRVKRAAGPRIIGVGDLVRVEWLPNSGREGGFLRFVTRETVSSGSPGSSGSSGSPGSSGFSGLPPEKDPCALDLWGSARRDLLTVLVATAVTARLPHPTARPEAAVGPPGGHHDVLLRRLRELGELHRGGVLTDEEFARTKAAVLRGFGTGGDGTG
ncbi:DUF4429 domain-containing protein [Streptomyces sp. JHA26]|uniref:DUF4429 domain-containing protein n=1 Tax=Streptomyces sp. JHA26 TaxID=1917143 RepID=UPI00098AE520|nr:DUF4429 domain-containing protein [Streptomyces sp. JHA26]